MARFMFAGLPNVTPDTPLEGRYRAVLTTLAYVVARGCYYNAKELMPDAEEDDVDQRYIVRSNTAANRARALLHRLRPDLEASFVHPEAPDEVLAERQKALDSLVYELALDYIDEMNKLHQQLAKQVEDEEITPFEAMERLAKEGHQLWQQMRGGPDSQGPASVKA